MKEREGDKKRKGERERGGVTEKVRGRRGEKQREEGCQRNREGEGER